MPDIFITENFLLKSDQAVELYHRFAEKMPIIDYHCHLPPREIAENRSFLNLTQIWLAGDHYKWRAMRTAGVAERFITGDASDREKFQKWAETVPQTLRNPLYHWTHLELKRPFGISDRLLNPQTAESIWNECNAKLARPEFSCRGIMRQMNVVVPAPPMIPPTAWNITPHWPPTPRFRSRFCPPSGRIRPRQWKTPRPLMPGWKDWPRQAART